MIQCVLINFIIGFLNLMHSQLTSNTLSNIPFEGVILDRHNYWRSIIANGHIPSQPNGSNIEKLLWEYQIQNLATNFTNECNADNDPIFDINILNQTNFEFQADFSKYQFGFNKAYFKYNASFNITDTFQVLSIVQQLIDEWFMEYQNYTFGDAQSDATKNYLNV